MEYIAVLEGLKGFQPSQFPSRRALGSNSRTSFANPRRAVDCNPCEYEASSECTYEMSDECVYEASAPCVYEASSDCAYEGSFDCNAGCTETIPAYVPPPQVYVPGIQIPGNKQFVTPVPVYDPIKTQPDTRMPQAPSTSFVLTPVSLNPNTGVRIDPNILCGPNGCGPIDGLKGKLGRLGKVFGK